jgi:hypothetical protein
MNLLCPLRSTSHSKKSSYMAEFDDSNTHLILNKDGIWVRVMVLNATFNNISVVSWRSVLLLEKTTDLPQITDILYHIMYRVHLAWAGFVLTTLVVIGIDFIGSYKFNDHTITTTTAPGRNECLVFGDCVTHYRQLTISPKRNSSLLVVVAWGPLHDKKKTRLSI